MTMELPAIARIAAALVAALLISFIATPVVKSIAQMVGAVERAQRQPTDGTTIPSPGWAGWRFSWAFSQYPDFCAHELLHAGMLLGA